jgi:ADP-ribosylglycohydrolase
VIDKFRGALYGVAIGDALGGTTEFMTASEIQQKYGRVTDIIGGGYWNLEPGETTDDTAMTMAVARGILKDPDHRYRISGRSSLLGRPRVRRTSGTSLLTSSACIKATGSQRPNVRMRS